MADSANDISSRAFWDLPFNERDKSFARLRATAPVSWHPPVEVSQEHAEAGFWAVTRAEDLTAVERDTEVFQSKYGINLTPTPVEQATAGVFFLTMDPPDGRIMGAVEEFVRYATPVMQFTRTAVKDAELNGAQVAAGDKVVLFFCSGNRDETVIEAPAQFNIARPRTSHVAFGAGGPHFCLGHGVARTQLRAIIGQLLTRLPNLELGEPVRLRSNFINGITALPAHVG